MRLFEILAGTSKGRTAPTSAPMYAWGDPNYSGSTLNGSLGDGSTNAARSSPTQIGSGSSWKYISAGGSGYGTHAAIKSDDTLWLWGTNDYGQVGNLTSGGAITSPVAVTGGGSWSQVVTSAYKRATIGIKTDGTMWAWGWANNYTLGRTIMGANPSWTCLDTTGVYVGGIQANTLYMWGTNSSYPNLHPTNGQDGSSYWSPVVALGPSTTVATPLGLSSSGSTYYYPNTQATSPLVYFSSGFISDVLKFQFMPGPAAMALIRVSPYANGYLSNTYLVGWGYNSNNSLRSLTSGSTTATPGLIFGDPVTDFWATRAGESTDSSVAVYFKSAANGNIYGYGHQYQTVGASGSSPYNGMRQSSPLFIMASANVGNVTKIAVGRTHSLALTNTGTAYAWGSSSYDGYAGYHVTHAVAGAQANAALVGNTSFLDQAATVVYAGASNTATNYLGITWRDLTGQPPYPSPGTAPNNYVWANTMLTNGSRSMTLYQVNAVMYVSSTTPGARRSANVNYFPGGQPNGPWASANSSSPTPYIGITLNSDQGDALKPAEPFIHLMRKLSSNTYSGLARRVPINMYIDPGNLSANIQVWTCNTVTANTYNPVFGFDAGLSYAILHGGEVTNGTIPVPSSGTRSNILYWDFVPYFPGALYNTGTNFLTDLSTYVEVILSSDILGSADQAANDFVTAFNSSWTSMVSGRTVSGGHLPNKINFQTTFDGRFTLDGITSITKPSTGRIRFTGTSVTTLSSGYTGSNRVSLQDWWGYTDSVQTYNMVNRGTITADITVAGMPNTSYSQYEGNWNAGYMNWNAGSYTGTDTGSRTAPFGNTIIIAAPETPYGNTSPGSPSELTPALIKYARWANGTYFETSSGFKSIGAGNCFSIAVLSKGGANLVLTWGNNTSNATGRSFNAGNANDFCIPTVISYTNGVYSNTGANWLWVDASCNTAYMQNGNEYAAGSNTPFPNNAMFFTGNNQYYQAGNSATSQLSMWPSGWYDITGGVTSYYRLDQNSMGLGGGSTGGHTVVGLANAIFANTQLANGTAIHSGYLNYFQTGMGLGLGASLFPPTPTTGTAQIYYSSPTQVGAPTNYLQSANTTNSWKMVWSDPHVPAYLAINADNTLYGWGVGQYQWLTDNAWTLNNGAGTQIRQLPISTSSFVFVTAGSGSNNWSGGAHYINPYAIKTDGTLWTWGFQNLPGSTGTRWANSTVNSSLGVTLKQVYAGDVASWKQVAASIFTTFGIASDDTLWAWGYNATLYGNNSVTGPMGDASNTTVNFQPWTKLETKNDSNTAVALANNKIYLWGKDDGANGALLGLVDGSIANAAFGTNIAYRYHAKQMWSNSQWSDVSIGDRYGMAVKTDGTLWLWGHNGNGELGNNSNTGNAAVPVQVAGSYISVSAGQYNPVAVKTDGTVWTWASLRFLSDANSAVGTDQIRYVSSPVQVGGLTGVSKVIQPQWDITSTIAQPMLALKTDGTLWGWGGNWSKIISPTDVMAVSSPVQIGDQSWTNVAMSPEGSMALGIKSDGTLWAWGSKFLLGRAADSIPPNWMFNSYNTLQTKRSWAMIDARSDSGGSTYAYAGITSLGELYMWGGAPGSTTTTVYTGPAWQSHPAPRKIDNQSWSMVSIGASHVAAIRSDGSLWTWGSNVYGELGLNVATTPINAPSQVGTSSWTAVAATQYLTMGIKADGTLWVWGAANGNQLGDNASTNRSSPVQLMAGNTFTKIAMTFGGGTKLAIQSTGALWTWGYNTYGETATGTITSVATPTKVGTSSWTQVTGGWYTCHAIRSDGALFGWGHNSWGTVGDNTILHRSSPVQIGTSSWTSVSTARTWHNAFGVVGGSLRAWGQGGGTGELITPLTNRSSPVLVNAGGAAGTFKATYGLSITTTGELRMFSQDHVTSGKVVVAASANVTLGGYTAIGDQPAIFQESPVQIAAGSYTQIGFAKPSGSSKVFMAQAIKTDGSLWRWGWNSLGILGDSTTVNKSSPIQIGTSSWAFVAADSALARDINNKWYYTGTEKVPFIYNWTNPSASGDKIGYIARQFIGASPYGYTQSYSAPVQIGTMNCGFFNEPVQLSAEKWASIKVGTATVPQLTTSSDNSADLVITAIKKTDFTLWMWGAVRTSTTAGQAGAYDLNSNTTFLTKATQIGSNTDVWVATSANDRMVLAIKTP